MCVGGGGRGGLSAVAVGTLSPITVLYCISRLLLPFASPLPLLQTVEAPALAVMVPLLLKGLRESTQIQRRCCLIITNMTKLVNSPLDAINFLPK